MTGGVGANGLETSGADPFDQATKALSLRSPFDVDDAVALARAPDLPAAIARQGGDAKKRHKKAALEVEGKVSAPPPKKTPFWDMMDPIFRPLTLVDVESLRWSIPPLSGHSFDSAFLMPLSIQSTEDKKADDKAGCTDVVDGKNISEVACVGEPVTATVEPEKQNETVAEEINGEEENAETRASAEVSTSGNNCLDKGAAYCEGSLNWLLGVKDRFLLTTEKPNKKRKLVGEDAGLGPLMVLPRRETLDEPICDVCRLGDSKEKSNAMLRCDSCGVTVHQQCYGVHYTPHSRWLCSWCKRLKLSKRGGGSDIVLRPCLLCPKDGGALKPVKRESGRSAETANLKYAHLFCSLWIPEVYVDDTKSMEPVMNVGSVQETRMKLICNICKVRHGASVRCSHGACRTSFHPICARDGKHKMEIWGKLGCDNVEMRAYCSKHSESSDIKENTFVHESNNLDDAVKESKDVVEEKFNTDYRKTPKFKFTRKKKDKNANLNTESTVKLGNKKQCEPSFSPDGDTGRMVLKSEANGNVAPISSSSDLPSVLRELLNRGKLKVADLASEVGISSESLEAALVGETTTFSPGLKSKIFNWLQSAGNIFESETTKGDGITQTVDAVVPVVDPLPSDGKSNGSLGTPDGSENPCTSGNSNCLPNGHNKVNQETVDDVDCSGDVEKCIDGKLLSVSSEGIPNKEDCPELDSICSEVSSAPEPVLQTTDDSRKKNDCSLPEQQLASNIAPGDGRSSDCSAMDNGLSCSNAYDLEAELTNHAFPEFDKSSFSIHPVIKKKLIHIWRCNCMPKKENNSATVSIQSDPQDSTPVSLCGQQKPDGADGTIQEQISKARSLGVLEFAPDNEVEAELIYYQACLIDKSLSLKHRYEKLIANVTQTLSHELDSLSRAKWDLIVVNKYLREVREVKKRGRKERKHKEAQAVLAAAAAAVAGSLRSTALRKDANEEIGRTEESPKISSVSGRAGHRSLAYSRAKDSYRPNRISPDRSSGFQFSILSKENSLFCDVCMRSETVLNRIFVCSICKAAVHLDCYHYLQNPNGPWKCEFCEDQVPEQPEQTEVILRLRCCSLCGGRSGAFRKTADAQWVHAFCAEWLLEAKFRRGQENPVEGLDLLSFEDSCYLCRRRVGACLKCSFGECQISFHPSCARDAGCYMCTKVVGDALTHKAYCRIHSTVQREADNQQYRPEDIKSMRQMRVELEKLRLLCERVIRREKLKRDLVICSHDILGARRDYVAFQARMRSILSPSAFSSESATTSVNNRSYSGLFQRSEDVTVDSNFSARNTIRLSLHNRDHDRCTEESTVSQLSFKRKLSDRTSTSGKQLPNRPASVALVSEDGENSSKDKKQRETFHKELIMTSDQASMQNQRLPKGFAYVPIGCVAKEKQRPCDPNTNESEEPGG